MIRFIILFFTLVSCAGPGTYEIVFSTIRSQLPGGKLVPVSEEFYLAQPYSFAFFKYGRKDPILLVLADIDNGIYQWVSEDRDSIFTDKNGMIIKTRGLNNDIFLQNFNNEGLSIGNIDINSFYSNYYDPELLNILSYIDQKSSLDISYDYFVGDNIPAIQYLVNKSVPAIKFYSEDVFVLEESKKGMLYSRQKIHPHLPYIEMRFYLKR